MLDRIDVGTSHLIQIDDITVRTAHAAAQKGLFWSGTAWIPPTPDDPVPMFLLLFYSLSLSLSLSLSFPRFVSAPYENQHLVVGDVGGLYVFVYGWC